MSFTIWCRSCGLPVGDDRAKNSTICAKCAGGGNLRCVRELKEIQLIGVSIYRPRCLNCQSFLNVDLDGHSTCPNGCEIIVVQTPKRNPLVTVICDEK